MSHSNNKIRLKINLLKISILLQVTILSLFVLNFEGIHIFLINQILVLLFLFFPGILVIKIIKIELSSFELLLISIGLSLISITLFVTLEDLFLLRFFPTIRPLSTVSLIVTILLLYFILNLILLFKVNDKVLDCSFPLSPVFFLVFLVTPLIMLLGKISGNAFVVFVVLIFISLYPILVVGIVYMGKELSLNDYILIIWSMSLSLMFYGLILKHPFNFQFDDQNPLITQTVEIARAWCPDYSVIHNSLLFSAIFFPVYSILSHTDIAIGTRIVSCIVFSLLPVCMFVIFSNFYKPSWAFLASCFYIFYPFYLQLPWTTRTGFGFLFTLLIIFLIIKEGIGYKKRLSLLILFVFSVAISHYGTFYMFLWSMLISFLLFYFANLNKKGAKNFQIEFKLFYYILLIALVTISWYVYTSRSQNFIWIIHVLQRVISKFVLSFLPNYSPAIKALVTKSATPSLSLELTKYMLFLFFILLLLGVGELLYSFIKNNRTNLKLTIITLGFASILIGITQIGMPRIFGFSLLVTAPLTLVGLRRLLKITKLRNNEYLILVIYSLLIFALFALTYGFVSFTVNSISGKIQDMSLLGPFNKQVLNSDNLYFKEFIYLHWHPIATYNAISWLILHQDIRSCVFIDTLLEKSHIFILHLPNIYCKFKISDYVQPKLSDLSLLLTNKMKNLKYSKNSYVFLSYHNIRDNFIYTIENGQVHFYNMSSYLFIFNKLNKIYTSVGGWIYKIK